MTTLTVDTPLAGANKSTGFWGRLGHRLVQSRQREAERAVAAYLLSLDDETLTTLGYSRSEIEARDPKGYPFL